jgi:hypothetical protein
LSGSAGNYGAGGANQRRKFNAAFALDPEAAMKACSWGKFQILGSNYAVCGYKTVGEFVDAMKESEGKQLDAFVAFVIGNKLDGHLRNKAWAKFARGYNGAGYAKNKYDVKMATWYAKFAKNPVNCDSVASNVPLGTTPVDSPIKPEPSDTVTSPPTEIEGVKPYNDVGLGGTLKNDAKAFLPANIGLSSISEWIQQTTGWPPWITALIPKLVIGVLICTALWLIYRIAAWVMHNWRENERVKLQAMINANPHMKDIVLK